ATLLGTNRQYLSTYINQEKQKTFYDYINDFRLEEAKALMDGMNSDRLYSLDEVAGMSGFNSYSTFLRSFAKKYGLTPSKYMREKGGGEQVSA
ncbi:MAG: helix-turn-helix domain-containing protein, partial [Bacteroidales bacterium]|nr:helix-turn-helix domain-containing protein [Bacteroidales bacterium]